MKQLALVILLVLLGGCSSRKDGQNSHGTHQETADPHAGHHLNLAGGMLMVKTDPAEVKAGQRATLHLMIHDADGTVIKDFDVVHEKKVHLIVVHDGLDQFAHIHPDQIDSAGNVTASFTFPTGGKYRLYADYKAVGKDSAVAQAEVEVAGVSPPAAKLTPNVPGKVAGDGLNANVSVENDKESAVRISFALSDQGDKPVTDLQPYLGAMGHLVVISADGSRYVHAHPVEDKATAGKVQFEADFPGPGIYKGWGQFQRAGKVYVVPFVIQRR
jgi:hypothetical protein